MLKNKNAVITGARGGIGRATVEAFAKNGASIWACIRSKDDKFESEMYQLAKKWNVEIRVLCFDLSDENQIKSIVSEIRKSKKPVDILVNNAGIVEESTSFMMTSIDKMRRVMETNFLGTTILTQYISRIMMRQNRGGIVNISSVAAIDGMPAQYEYASSKAALLGGVKQLSRELAEYNIRVNAVAPGIVNTKMGDKIDEELKKETLSRIAMKRMGNPNEIANVIMFLASDLSSYITGQVIRVDGGI